MNLRVYKTNFELFFFHKNDLFARHFLFKIFHCVQYFIKRVVCVHYFKVSSVLFYKNRRAINKKLRCVQYFHVNNCTYQI